MMSPHDGEYSSSNAIATQGSTRSRFSGSTKVREVLLLPVARSPVDDERQSQLPRILQRGAQCLGSRSRLGRVLRM